MKRTGLGSRIDARSNPLHCIGDLGITICEHDPCSCQLGKRKCRKMTITLSPEAPTKKPSGLCEWYKPPCPTAIVGVRIVKPPIENCPPARYLYLAASFTIYMGAENCISHNISEAYLVKSRENVVRELYLCDGCVAHRCNSNTETSDALLRQRGVKNTFATYP